MLFQIDCGSTLAQRGPSPSDPGTVARRRQARLTSTWTTSPRPRPHPVRDRVEHAPQPPVDARPRRGRSASHRASPSRERVEPDRGDPDDWSFLRRPALLGFIAVVSICVGASLPSSPFKLEGSMGWGGAWFFGEAPWPTTAWMLPGVVAVYGGMVLFVRVWFGLYQTLRARPNVPIKSLAYMLALWILPLLAVAPLFSRDVFSYAAQGEMMSHHINPYHYGPGTLGSGPFVNGRRSAAGSTPPPPTARSS